MSKSNGNVIDPLDAVNSFSADSLRFTLAILAIQGRDIKLSNDRLEQMRNFTNKLYNASKYLLLNQSSFKNLDEIEIKSDLGKYMQSRLYQTTKEVRQNLDSYRFNDAATALYRFLWNEFCDWGIELSKAEKSSVSELGAIFKEAMKLLHPFMPFISEHLYQNLSATSLKDSKSIMIMKYPEKIEQNKEIENTFNLVIEAIVSIRRAKATIDLANQSIEVAHIKLQKNIEHLKPFITRLAKCKSVEFVKTNTLKAIRDVSDNLEVFIPLSGIDLTPIIDRLKNQAVKLEKEVAKLNGMLSNKKFIENAPKEVISQNEKLFKEAKEKLEKVNEELESLTKKDG